MKSDIYHISVHPTQTEPRTTGCSAERCAAVHILLDGLFSHVLILFLLVAKDKDQPNLYLQLNLDKSLVSRTNTTIYLLSRVAANVCKKETFGLNFQIIRNVRVKRYFIYKQVCFIECNRQMFLYLFFNRRILNIRLCLQRHIVRVCFQVDANKTEDFYNSIQKPNRIWKYFLKFSVNKFTLFAN